MQCFFLWKNYRLCLTSVLQTQIVYFPQTCHTIRLADYRRINFNSSSVHNASDNIPKSSIQSHWMSCHIYALHTYNFLNYKWTIQELYLGWKRKVGSCNDNAQQSFQFISCRFFSAINILAWLWLHIWVKCKFIGGYLSI